MSQPANRIEAGEPERTPSNSANAPLSDATELNALRTWRNVYGEAAKASDWVTAHRWHEVDRPREAAEDVRAKLRSRPGDFVLEVGCGSGAVLALVLEDGQCGVGLDQCEALIHRAADFGVDRARLHLGVADASRLPVCTETVDRVFSYSVFQCFPSEDYARRVLDEMLRVCKPGGVIMIGDLHGDMEKQARFLEGLGLSRAMADGLLSPFAPFWRLKQRLRGGGDGLFRRAYSRKFFHRALQDRSCAVEFLRQEVAGRPYERLRYDLRITKRSGMV